MEEEEKKKELQSEDEAWVRTESGMIPHFHHGQPARGLAPPGKGMNSSLYKLGSEGHKGCVGGGSHHYWETSVYM